VFRKKLDFSQVHYFGSEALRSKELFKCEI
jgi:hypothetical protein